MIADPRLEAAAWAIAWVIAWGTIAALIGPRKGYTPIGAFGIGAVFAVFGVVYLALRPDAPSRGGG